MKLEDIILKKGDVVYFSDGDKLCISYDYKQKLVDEANSASVKEDIIKIERPVQYKTIYEAPKQILDKEEKEYLENFLRPFKNWDIRFLKTQSLNDGEFLLIQIGIVSAIKLPPFKKNTMYKGMELNKEYTLKELGLFEE